MANIKRIARNLYNNLTYRGGTPGLGSQITSSLSPNLKAFLYGQRNIPNEVVQMSRDRATTPKNPLYDVARDIILNRIKQGSHVVQGVRDMTAGYLQNNDKMGITGAAQSLGGLYNLTPTGSAQNLGQSGIAGLGAGMRNRKPLSSYPQNASQGMAEDQLASEGLGIRNPAAALGVNALAGAGLHGIFNIARNPGKYTQIGRQGRGFGGGFETGNTLGNRFTPRPPVTPKGPKMKDPELLEMIRRNARKRY